MGQVLNNGRWHSVTVERNIMEVMVMVDLKEIKTIKMKHKSIAKNPFFLVSEFEVFNSLFYEYY